MTETPELLKNNVLVQSNKFIKHGIKYAPGYLILALFAITCTVFVLRFLKGNPIIFGQESYFLLSFFEQFVNLPQKVVRLGLFGFNFVAATGSIVAGYFLTKKLKWDPYIQFFFLSFIVVSPAFIYISSTISHFPLTLLLLLTSILLLYSSKELYQYGAIIPIVLVGTFDVLSAFIGSIIAVLFYPHSRKEKKFMILCGALVVIMMGLWFFTTPLTQSIIPYPTKSVSQISSDLGSFSGVSLFLLLLAFLGLLFWEKMHWKLVFLLFIVMGTFLLNPTFIIFLAIILSYFAAKAIVSIFDRKWTLETIKGFTLLLIGLGFMFSTLVYTQGLIENSPTREEYFALSFVNSSVDENAIVLADPNQAVYVRYFARRTPYVFTSIMSVKEEEYKTILSAGYVGELFPLLEKNSIQVIYINPTLREQLDPEQGLLFLLKNERFKMLYALDNTGVWLFNSSEK